MGLLLDRVFASNNIFDVFDIALVLKSLGAVEVTLQQVEEAVHEHGMCTCQFIDSLQLPALIVSV